MDGWLRPAQKSLLTLYGQTAFFEGQPSSSDSLRKTNITENVQRTSSPTENLVQHPSLSGEVMTQLRRHCHPVSSKQGP